MKPEGDERTDGIIGAAMEVHRILGHWYLEAVYQEALETELRLRGIAFVAQTLNSMECAKVHIGLLVNFGESSLKWKRLIL